VSDRTCGKKSDKKVAEQLFPLCGKVETVFDGSEWLRGIATSVTLPA
jgi:endogenous inhibitor of DNA gyrase (YacG/DUF329 family)